MCNDESDLRCNALKPSMSLWWLCSKVRVKRGDEGAEIRWKVGETDGGDDKGWGIVGTVQSET